MVVIIHHLFNRHKRCQSLLPKVTSIDGIDIVYANTRVRITGIPKRFNDFIRTESQRSIDSCSTRVVSENSGYSSQLSVLDAGGFHDSITPTASLKDGTYDYKNLSMTNLNIVQRILNAHDTFVTKLKSIIIDSKS